MTHTIIVQVVINAAAEKVWKFYTEPRHITQWNNASADWHTPSAQNDVRVGGKFVFRMEAKDGSEGFDFEGTYSDVKFHKLLSYSMSDGRAVKVTFDSEGAQTKVVVTFDPENVNSVELQRDGWQAILDNFKRYVENN